MTAPMPVAACRDPLNGPHVVYTSPGSALHQVTSSGAPNKFGPVPSHLLKMASEELIKVKTLVTADFDVL